MQSTGLILFLSLLGGALPLRAQFQNFPQPQGERVSADDALERALRASSLTKDGKPFHAVLEIGDSGSPYSGRLEIWWSNEKKYKVSLTSPSFSQTRIVNGDGMTEANTGDYYPRWLQNFVDGLLNPIPMIANFSGSGGAVVVGADDHEKLFAAG